MRKLLITTALTVISTLASAQDKPAAKKVEHSERPAPAEAGPVDKTAETQFQDKKLQEAQDKQEARRKAMKERAKSKESKEQ